MIQRMKQLLVDFWIVLAFGLAAVFLMPQANAALIGVEDLERERVKAMLERPELTQQLSKTGIAVEDARARVDAMSDAEVLQLAGRLDAAIAGGQMSNESVLLIVIIVLLIIIII
jgi:hypothetical protein